MKTDRRTFPQEIIRDLVSYLEMLERKGIRSLYLEPLESDPPRAAAEPTAIRERGEPLSLDVTTERLAEIEAEVRVCTKCALHKSRTNTVFGKGDPKTQVMFIGEGPGRDEDLQGAPFVGRSGQLLTKMIEWIELKRENVYITNMVKCRPPQNRDPLEEEVRCCEQYLISQIDAIKPRVICALGRIAAQWLLDTNAPLSALRARENNYHDTPVVVTYHPAALLRNPPLRKQAAEDLQKLRSMIGR